MAVNGWGFGAGEQVFYTCATPDGQIVMSTVELTSNELDPTADHAELAVFDPARMIFQRLVIPTSQGATTAVTPGDHVGGTDAGGGDLRVVTVSPGVQKILFTCDGYYFGWSIPVTGLYPALGYLKLSAGNWIYDSAASLTGDQWQATNPTAFAVLAPSGQTAGNGANYYSPSFPDQIAVLPSGNVVIGHYFGPGSHKSGCISVVSPAGSLLAAYQIPDITPITGTLTDVSPRDVQADPSSVAGDERFCILYDSFGTGITATFQEYSFNSNTNTITPVSEPCTTTDTDSAAQYVLYGPDGTLYVSCSAISNGFVARNLNVYLKHAGGRNLTTVTPFTSWSGTWPTPVRPDYSLGFTVQQGLGFAGPMVIDTARTNALLLVSNSGNALLGGTVPDSSIRSLTPVPGQQWGFGSGTPASQGWTSFVTGISIFQNGANNWLQIQAAFNAGTVAFGPKFGVTPGREYLCKAFFQAAPGTPGQQCQAQLQFFDVNGNSLPLAAGSMLVTDAGTGFAEAWGAAVAPPAAVTCYITLSCSTVTAGQAHYCTAVNVYQQPFQAVAPADIGITTLRGKPYNIGATRPSIANRVLYVPLGNAFSATESALWSQSTYVPDTRHPQYLAAVNVDAFLATPAPQPGTQRYYQPGIRRVYWVTSIASPGNPTRAELNAGTDLSAEVLTMAGWQATVSTVVQIPDIVSRFTEQLPGPLSLVESSITFYESSTHADVRTVLTPGTAGFIVALWEGDVSGQLMDVFGVRVLFLTQDPSVTDPGQVLVGFGATTHPLTNVLIP